MDGVGAGNIDEMSQDEKLALIEYYIKLVNLYETCKSDNNLIQRFLNNNLICALSNYSNGVRHVKRLIENVCVNCSSTLSISCGKIMSKQKLLKYHTKTVSNKSNYLFSYYNMLKNFKKSSYFYVKKCSICNFMNGYKIKRINRKKIHNNYPVVNKINQPTETNVKLPQKPKIHHLFNLANKSIKNNSKNDLKKKESSSLMAFLNKLDP